MDATARPRRSVLYMPGSNARALEKGRSLPADALILDLEDAVAPDAKDQARGQIAEAVTAGGYGRRELAICGSTAWTRPGAGTTSRPPPLRRRRDPAAQGRDARPWSPSWRP